MEERSKVNTRFSPPLTDQEIHISSDSLRFSKCAHPLCSLSPPRSIKDAKYCSFHYPLDEWIDDNQQDNWSIRCRHVIGESEWSNGHPGNIGTPCRNIATPGSCYCKKHICSRCLSDCTSENDLVNDSPILYPCCTPNQCRWMNMMHLQTLTPFDVPDDRKGLMMQVSKLIIFNLPHICVIYGGFLRDYIFRNELPNDLDVVIFPPSTYPLSSFDKNYADKRLEILNECMDKLVEFASILPIQMKLESKRLKSPSRTSKDYLGILVLAPIYNYDLYGSIQVEFALDGSYADGEVDADINNLCIGGGMSILPRDRSAPFSPPHILRHIVNKEYAYIRQTGLKIGIGRLWKLYHRGWKRVAMIPCSHPDATTKCEIPSVNWMIPNWTCCPLAREILSIH